MKKFIVIDGNAILHRAWHALPPTLMTNDGTIVNAVYGFTSILLKVIGDQKPDLLAVAWDTAAKTFRKEKYEQYKATRKKKEQELYDQVPIIKDMLDAFAIPNVLLDGYEADDVIGTLAERAKKEKDLHTVIVTGDLDSLQLVDNSTRVYTLKKGISDTVIYNADAVMDRYGLTPEQIIDFKALKGDPSDNIKGVKGIGEKTAIELLQKYKTLDGLYKALSKPGAEKDFKPAQFKKLVEGKDDAYFSQELVTIVRDVPVDFKFKDAVFGDYDIQDVVGVFQKLGFKSLLARIPNHAKMAAREESKSSIKSNKDQYFYITSKKDCEKMVKILEKQHIFAFDTETTGVRPFQDEILGLSICFKEKEAYYIQAEAITDSLKKVFADKKIKKIAHNAKFDIEFLEQAGIPVNDVVFDTKVAAYLLNPGARNSGLKGLAFTEFGEQMTTLESLLGKGKSALTMRELAEQKPQELADYAAADADFTFRLHKILEKRLKEEKLLDVFTNIDMPLIEVLVELETNGVLLDVKKLKDLSKIMAKKISVMEKEIHQLGKGEFNISSPKQLAVVLFDKLELPTGGIKKTKTGYSTAASELEKLAVHHPIVSLIGDYRAASKLKSTYLDTLPELVNPKTKRVHTSFNQTVTATGRLSSSDPNLQNIPIRTEEGKKIREAFIAPKGYKLISSDYSQIELRVIASLAKDKSMMQSFKDGEDIHKRTAANIHEIDIEDVTTEMRYAAKAINFGIIYGQGAWGLAQTAKISVADAKDFIYKYFKKHKAIEEYLEAMKQQARDKGYVETLFGRKRYIPEINSTVSVVRAQAERIAINMPIQGTAADLLKMTMSDIHHLLKKKYKPEEVKMLLSVHDELVFEVRDDLVDEVAKFVDKVMEKPRGIELDVPIKVDTEVGQNWGEMESVY